MPLSFNCLYFFENQEIFIVELERMDLSAGAVQSDTHNWLLVDKDSLAITQLVLLAFNSSGFSQERFFKQAYLSFDALHAVFIRESSALQVILQAKENSDLPEQFNVAIQEWLYATGLY